MIGATLIIKTSELSEFIKLMNKLLKTLKLLFLAFHTFLLLLLEFSFLDRIGELVTMFIIFAWFVGFPGDSLIENLGICL